LAKYLDILDKNDTLYNEYFWWKPFYKLVGLNYNILKLFL
jgi:hypothetical protein